MNEVLITSKNFALMLNLGKISKDTLDKVNKELNGYSREITEMVVREQQDQETINNLGTTKEVIGVGTDFGKALINKAANEGLTQDVSFTSVDRAASNENNERVGKLEKSEDSEEKNVFNAEANQQNIGQEIENDIKAAVIENQDLLKQNGVFTEEELNKILRGGTDGIPHMFDYSLGTGGNAKDMEVDLRILDKCCGCTLKNEKNEYIFKKFLILDGEGNAVNPKLINKNTIGYILNFGLQGECKTQNKESIDKILKVTKIRENGRKVAKLRGNANLLKLIKRSVGVDIFKREFREYTNQLKPIKHVAKTATLVEKAIKTGYKGTKFLSLRKTRIEYKNAKTAKNTKLAINLFKKKKVEEAAFKKIENVTGTIRHPIKKVGSVIANKFKSSVFAKKIAEKAKNTTLAKLYRSLNDALSQVFKVVGKVVNPIVLLVRAIVIKIMIIFAPIILLLIIYIVVGFSAASSSTTSTIITYMPLADYDDFVAYQSHYDTLDDNFLMSLESYLGNYATTLNLKGEKIRYGINGQNNEEGMENDDFQNGMYYRFITDDEHAGRSSNIEDLIAMMAIIMTQSQADNREVALKIIEWLYDISHSYTYVESPLYACDSACHNIHYECNDHFHEYSDTDIRYNPFHARNKSGGDYEIKEAEDFCEVCNDTFNTRRNNTNCVIASNSNATKEDFYGCVVSQKCYHGIDSNMGRTMPTYCSDYDTIYMCPGHEYHTATTAGIRYCSGPLGCQGYYECNGHDHYVCNGHEYKCCLGHADIQMNVQIKFYEELKDIINNYDFGENDIYYQDVVSKKEE